MARKVISKSEAKQHHEVNWDVVTAVSPWFYAENWNHIILNDNHVRMMLCNSYSAKEKLNWGEVFRGLGGTNAHVSMVLRNPGAGAMRGNIVRTRNESSEESWGMNYFDRKEKEFEAEQASDAADMMIRSNAKIFETYLYASIRCENPDELWKLSNAASQAVDGATKSVNSFFCDQEPMLFAASPFMCPDPYCESTNNWAMPSTTVAMALFNQERGICDPSGIPIGDDLRQGLIRIDPTTTTKSRANRNWFISGESGSGKTTLMRILITYFRCLYGFKCFINDIEGEYGQQVEALGGVSFDVDAMHPNPFIPRNIASSGDDADDDGAEITEAEMRAEFALARQANVLSTHLPFLVNYLCTAFAVSQDSTERDVLYLACEKAYEKKGIDIDMTFEELDATPAALRSLPSLKDVHASVLDLASRLHAHRQSCMNLELKLRRGVTGSDRGIWEDDGRSIPDGAGLIRMNLQTLSEDPAMQAAQYYNVLTWEWSQVRMNRYAGKHIAIFNDEAHKMANRANAAAAFKLKDMSQRIRKYGALLVTATQMISDLFDKEIRSAGEGIVYNSAFQFFGKTSGDLKATESNNAKETQSLLGCPESVIKDLARAPQGRFIARVGTDQQSWMRVHQLEPWEKQLFGKGSGK